jgi:peptidoglycan/LPS O-acetylase OafA/YrhL
MDDRRILGIDGLRGIAILLVVFYHSFSRWTELYPYGDQYKNELLFNYGWVGVQLFFMISGFVIYMSLDNSKGFDNFIYKRWLRLFPAMLCATLIVFASSFFLTHRPAGNPSLLSIVPGLTFIEYGWWKKILGLNFNELEGAFWSIYAEFKFYVIAAFVYFYFSKRMLPYVIFSMFLLFKISYFFSDMKPIYYLYKIMGTLSFEHFGWFSVGCFFYRYFKSGKDKNSLYFTIFSFLLSIVLNKSYIDFTLYFVLFFVGALFFLSVKSHFVGKVLSNPLVMFFGFISYPLYLVHENSLVSMMIQLSDILNTENVFVIFLLSLSIVIFVSYFIAKRLEPLVRGKIKNIIGCFFNFSNKDRSV